MRGIKLIFIFCLVRFYVGWFRRINLTGRPWFTDNDFAHHYLTGRLVLEKQNPYLADLLQLYKQYGFEVGFSGPNPTAPPALAILLAPFATMSPQTSFILWTIFQLGSLILGVLLLIRHLKIRLSYFDYFLVILGALGTSGVFAHIRYGQAQLILFFLVILGLRLIDHNKRVAQNVGLVCWGISVSFKLFTLPLLYVAYRYKGIRGVFWFGIGFTSLTVPFIGLCGIHSIETFVHHTLPYTRELASQFTGNISLSGSVVRLQRLIVGHDLFSPLLLQQISALLLLPYSILEWRYSRDLVASTLSVLVVSCLISPTAWAHYLPLLTGGFIYIGKCIADGERAGISWVTLLSLYLAMAMPLDWMMTSHEGQIAATVWTPACMGIMLVLLRRARIPVR